MLLYWLCKLHKAEPKGRILPILPTRHSTRTKYAPRHKDWGNKRRTGLVSSNVVVNAAKTREFDDIVTGVAEPAISGRSATENTTWPLADRNFS